MTTNELFAVEALAQIAEGSGKTFEEAMRALAGGDQEFLSLVAKHAAQLMHDVRAEFGVAAHACGPSQAGQATENRCGDSLSVGRLCY